MDSSCIPGDELLQREIQTASVDITEMIKDVDKVKSYFEDALKLLSVHSWVYDFNWTRMLVNQDPLQAMPQEWIDCLSKLHVQELNSVPFGFSQHDWPDSFKTFVEQALKLSLRHAIPCASASADVPPHIGSGMSQKKLHEVKHTASCIANVCKEVQASVVIDIGSGMGYLDEILHHNYGFTVIGFDSKETLCHGASKRLSKTGGCKKGIQYYARHVTAEKEFVDELRNMLRSLPNESCDCGKRSTDNEETRCILVGLHCCGDLGPTICKLFCSIKEIDALVLIGCCYHKMSSVDGDARLRFFPLSATLQSIYEANRLQKGPLGFGLRLASQFTRAKWAQQSELDHDFHSKHVAYRAIAEVSLKNSGLEWRKPRRHIARKQDFTSFPAYCLAVLDGYTCTDQEKQKQMDNLLKVFQQYQTIIPLIEPMTLLQVLLQPVWESLLVLDRCWYLHESAVENIQVQAIFNEQISPRNIALIGKK